MADTWQHGQVGLRPALQFLFYLGCTGSFSTFFEVGSRFELRSNWTAKK